MTIGDVLLNIDFDCTKLKPMIQASKAGNDRYGLNMMRDVMNCQCSRVANVASCISSNNKNKTVRNNTIQKRQKQQPLYQTKRNNQVASYHQLIPKNKQIFRNETCIEYELNQQEKNSNNNNNCKQNISMSESYINSSNRGFAQIKMDTQEECIDVSSDTDNLFVTDDECNDNKIKYDDDDNDNDDDVYNDEIDDPDNDTYDQSSSLQQSDMYQGSILQNLYTSAFKVPRQTKAASIPSPIPVFQPKKLNPSTIIAKNKKFSNSCSKRSITPLTLAIKTSKCKNQNQNRNIATASKNTKKINTQLTKKFYSFGKKKTSRPHSVSQSQLNFNQNSVTQRRLKGQQFQQGQLNGIRQKTQKTDPKQLRNVQNQSSSINQGNQYHNQSVLINSNTPKTPPQYKAWSLNTSFAQTSKNKCNGIISQSALSQKPPEQNQNSFITRNSNFKQSSTLSVFQPDNYRNKQFYPKEMQLETPLFQARGRFFSDGTTQPNFIQSQFIFEQVSPQNTKTNLKSNSNYDDIEKRSKGSQTPTKINRRSANQINSRRKTSQSKACNQFLRKNKKKFTSMSPRRVLFEQQQQVQSQPSFRPSDVNPVTMANLSFSIGSQSPQKFGSSRMHKFLKKQNTKKKTSYSPSSPQSNPIQSSRSFIGLTASRKSYKPKRNQNQRSLSQAMPKRKLSPQLARQVEKLNQKRKQISREQEQIKQRYAQMQITKIEIEKIKQQDEKLSKQLQAKKIKFQQEKAKKIQGPNRKQSSRSRSPGVLLTSALRIPASSARQVLQTWQRIENQQHQQ